MMDGSGDGKEGGSGALRSSRMRVWVLLALLVAMSIYAYQRVIWRHAPGCAAYLPVSGPILVAHAGGATPDRTYANSISALDRSYARGMRVFEMDFYQLPFGLMRTGHDPSDLLDPRGAWLGDVIDWFRRHPDARLITDMKTDNVRGLRLVAARAPDLRRRIAPFLYAEEEYEPVRALGFLPPVARLDTPDPRWWAFANAHAFTAIASRMDLSRKEGLRHPFLLFTRDEVPDNPRVWGVITDCMIPATR